MSEDGAAAPRNTAPLPWGDNKAERADMILIGGITFAGLYTLAMLPLTPVLVGEHPVVLELSRAR